MRKRKGKKQAPRSVTIMLTRYNPDIYLRLLVPAPSADFLVTAWR
jgi:hypothetical protein